MGTHPATHFAAVAVWYAAHRRYDLAEVYTWASSGHCRAAVLYCDLSEE